MRPTAQIQEGIFIDDFEGYNLFIGRLDDRTGKMQDVLIIDASESRGSPAHDRAQSGRPALRRRIRTRSRSTLRDGEIHEADPDAKDGRYHRLAFARADDAPIGRRRGARERPCGAIGASARCRWRQMKKEIATLEKEQRPTRRRSTPR